MKRVLCKTKQRVKPKKFFGFDIETANNNKDFVLGTIYGDEYQATFHDRESMIREMTNRRFRGAYFVATNLQFDFNTLFKEQGNFHVLYRGSHMISAHSYVHNNTFQNTVKRKKVTFLDTLNYCMLSVEAIGKILSIGKLDKPPFLGEYPANEEEQRELAVYCMRDSEISQKFMVFLEQGLLELGGDMKSTIASSSMKLWRNRFLDTNYFINDKEQLRFQFESYFGGRTEAFVRGNIFGANYYDINSLYPSVMRDNVFPDPNTIRENKINDYRYIKEFEGCAEVEVYEFESQYPVLPVRTKTGKVLFAYGNKRGVWTNAEIRYAVEQGAVVKKIHKNMYFRKTCTPFTTFVDELYTLRQTYKEDDNKLEVVVKLIMNSLYGKFGQRFDDKESLVHKDIVTIKDLQGATFERLGDWFRIKKNGEPTSFTIPIWASYVSAYGRIKLHQYLKTYGGIYCDTDSIVTYNTIPESKALGLMKKEMTIEEGYIVRPKFYAFCSDKGQEHVKIKGLGKRLTYLEFRGLLAKPSQKVYYKKFTKFKESLRQHLIPNEIRMVHKEFSLEDEKRLWEKPFNMDELQESRPICLTH